MATNQTKPNKDESGIDFSHFMDNAATKNKVTAPNLHRSFLTKKNIIILLFIIATAALAYTLYIQYKNKPKIKAPEGYRIIQSDKEPPKLEKIK